MAGKLKIINEPKLEWKKRARGTVADWGKYNFAIGVHLFTSEPLVQVAIGDKVVYGKKYEEVFDPYSRETIAAGKKIIRNWIIRKLRRDGFQIKKEEPKAVKPKKDTYKSIVEDMAKLPVIKTDDKNWKEGFPHVTHFDDAIALIRRAKRLKREKVKS